MSLALAMIVKNEEKNLIRCLESCWHIFDEVVILDTGSTDKTKENFYEFMKDKKEVSFKCENYRWNDDFAAARNESFGLVESDWVMWLDADDILKQPDEIKRLYDENKNDYDCIIIPYHYNHDSNGNVILKLMRERIIRKSKAQWEYPIHECILLGGLRTFFSRDDKHAVSHMRTAEDMSEDGGRNLRIFEEIMNGGGKWANDHRMIFYYGNELRDAGKYEQAIEVYKKLDSMDGFIEEKYKAKLSIASCFGKDKIDESIKTLHEAILLCPNFYDAYFMIAMFYKNKNDLHKSKLYFESCLKLDFDEMSLGNRNDLKGYKPCEELEKIYDQLNMPEKALEMCEKLLEYFPNLDSLLSDRNYCRRRIIEKYEKIAPPINGKVCLNLGSGGQKLVGMYSCDKYDENSDLKFDMRFIPFNNRSVDLIKSEHSLEHLTYRNAVECIKECSRVLKPGGTLHLEIPNAEECAVGLMNKNKVKNNWYQMTLWGRQYTKDIIDNGQFHKCGFTRDIIENLLDHYGFFISDMKFSNKYGTPSIEIIAIKRVKIYYMDSGNVVSATTRLRRIPIYKTKYKDHPIDVIHINDSKGIKDDASAVVFTSFNEDDFNLAKKLKEKGVKRYFDHNEAILEFPGVKKMLGEMDTIFCCSEKLKEITESVLGKKCCVVLTDTYEFTRNML